MRALQSQLHPHFLFNTLHSVSTLMHRDVAAADTMLARLSDMLRATLDNDGAQEVSLAAELQMLAQYLDIMQVRFADRLTTDIDVPEALLTERVPRFILQPLVENVIRHGIDEASSTTRVHVVASATGHALILRILDDGRGLPLDEVVREGIGLHNTRRRLERLYSDGASLSVANRAQGGVEVTITLPRRLVGLPSHAKVFA